MMGILLIFAAHRAFGRPMESSFLQPILCQNSIVAHEPDEKMYYQDGLLSPQSFPNHYIGQAVWKFL